MSSTQPLEASDAAVADRAVRLVGLDAVRGLAAVAVVSSTALASTWAVGTIPGQVTSLLSYTGVAAFALISSLLVGRFWAFGLPLSGLPLGASGAPPASGWLLRRVARIAPTFWLVSVVYLWTSLVFPSGRVAREGRVTVPTFVHLYTDRAWPPGTELWWAVSVHVAIIVLVALAGTLVARRGVRVPVAPDRFRPGRVAVVVVAASAAAILWRFGVAGQGASFHLQNWPPAYFDWVAMGCGLGVVTSRVEAGAWRLPAWVNELANHAGFTFFAAIGVLVVTAQGRYGAAAVAVNGAQRELRHYGTLTVAVLVLIPVLFSSQPSALPRWLRGSTLRLAGTLSLGLFLWHSGAAQLVDRQVREGNLPENAIVRVLMVLVTSAVLAGVSYLLVERPVGRILADRSATRRQRR